MKRWNPSWTMVAVGLGGFLVGGWLFAPDAADESLPPEPGGEATSTAAEDQVTWTCAMHPEVRTDAKGACPICGMGLVPAEAGEAASTVSLSPDAARLARIRTAAVVGVGIATLSALELAM